MSDTPFRLRVLQALTVALQGVSRATGPYTYDFSASVFRGRAIFGNNDELPMLSILEQPKSPESDPAPPLETASQRDWDLMVQGFISDDPVNPTDPAYYIAADVVAALQGVVVNRDILGLGSKKPCVLEMHIGAPVIRPGDHDISSTTYFWLPLRLRLVEDAANAFT